MRPRTHGEKKRLIPITQEDILNQNNSFQLLSVLPPINVVPFKIVRAPVLASVLEVNDVEQLENLDPGTVKQTETLKLVRAEKPINFDVISLTRVTAGEENPNALEFAEEAIPENDEEDEEQNGEWEY